uniref:uncharacterized protein LOC120329738 n=1 Tax=Styela clava TaxID=7725 RepID=UPI0019394E3D|nr:uncharacterized protein LOC120329738 [Styela clava]
MTNGILGMDYLREHDCVLYLSSGHMMIEGHEIKLFTEKSVPCCRVTVREDITIPPYSKLISSVVDPGKSTVPVLAVNQKGRQLKIRAGSLIGIAHPQLVAQIQVDESDNRVIASELPEHLHDMVNSVEDLTPSQREQLVNLICEFHDVFVGPDGELGRTSAAKHRIITTTPQPIRQAPRRMGWARRKIAEEAVDNMLAQGVIEPSDSP